jgi:hypothetical protein
MRNIKFIVGERYTNTWYLDCTVTERGKDYIVVYDHREKVTEKCGIEIETIGKQKIEKAWVNIESHYLYSNVLDCGIGGIVL